jgi:hypothetical protein
VASGQATAAPPRRVVNSRRLIRPSVGTCDPQVPGVVHMLSPQSQLLKVCECSRERTVLPEPGGTAFDSPPCPEGVIRVISGICSARPVNLQLRNMARCAGTVARAKYALFPRRSARSAPDPSQTFTAISRRSGLGRERTGGFRVGLDEKRPFPNFGISAARPFSATQPSRWECPPAHLEGLFQDSAWYDGSTSTAMVKEI